MCTICGCSDTQQVSYTVPGADLHSHDHDAHVHSHDHDHSHPHSHDHADAHSLDRPPAHLHDHFPAHSHDHFPVHSHDPAHAHSRDPAHAHSRDQSPAHAHDHTHPHSHDHGEARHAGMHGRTIAVEQDILAKNQILAERNRGWFEGREVVALNLMSSPGSGKTTALECTIRALINDVRIYVVEGDQATTNDAERIGATGCEVIQINTGAGCHLEADMLARGLQQLNPRPGSLVLIENVGNLVCPALFDLGERAKVVMLSVTEGDDKPAKYPHMFRACRLMLINKMDLLPYVRFDVDRCIALAREVNPDIEVLQVSAETGAGMHGWYQWIRRQLLSVPDRASM